MSTNLSQFQPQPSGIGVEQSAEIVVLVTASSEEEAHRIARTVVEAGLVACANILSPIKSIYIWEHKVTEDTEILMLFKTKRHLFHDLEQAIKRLHSYELPEIIALPIVMGSEDYLGWITMNTRKLLK
jgi:periplasmic divalent cation tolerance protein